MQWLYLQKRVSLLPEFYQLLEHVRKMWGLEVTSQSVLGICVVWSCRGSHNCCECIYVVAISYLEDRITHYSSTYSDSYVLSVIFFMIFPELLYVWGMIITHFFFSVLWLAVHFSVGFCPWINQKFLIKVKSSLVNRYKYLCIFILFFFFFIIKKVKQYPL